MTDRYADAEVGEMVWELFSQQMTNDESVTIDKGDAVTLTDGYTVQPYVGHEADAGDVVFGIATEDIAQNESGLILVIGVIKVTFGAAVTAFAALKAANDALLDPATAGDNALVCGRALQKGADGDTGLVLIMPNNSIAPS